MTDDTLADTLHSVGQRWNEARKAERLAAEQVHTAIRHAASTGMPETQIAAALGVNRMTVRKALGKL